MIDWIILEISNQRMCLVIIPQSMTAVFRIFSWSIILDWPPFYCNDEVLQSMLGIIESMHHAVSQFTRGDMSPQHSPQTCSCNVFMCV